MEIALLTILLIISIICGILFTCYYYQKGKKAGADALLKGIFEGGFIQKIKNFKILNQVVSPNGTVFVGDSLIQDYNVYEWFLNCKTYNRGIGGDTTRGLLNRLDVSVFELNPKNVVLLIGTNDLELTNDNEETIYRRIEKIVETINKEIKTNIYILSLLPTNKNMDKNTVGKRSIEKITCLNSLLTQIKGARYIDVFSHLVDETNNLNPNYSVEGLHLNQEGYKVITNILKPLLF